MEGNERKWILRREREQWATGESLSKWWESKLNEGQRAMFITHWKRLLQMFGLLSWTATHTHTHKDRPGWNERWPNVFFNQTHVHRYMETHTYSDGPDIYCAQILYTGYSQTLHCLGSGWFRPEEVYRERHLSGDEGARSSINLWTKGGKHNQWITGMFVQ